MMMMMVIAMMMNMTTTHHRSPGINSALQAFDQLHLVGTNWRGANHLVVRDKIMFGDERAEEKGF